MKKFIPSLCMLVWLSGVSAPITEPSNRYIWQDSLLSSEGRFDVKVDEKKKTVEVVQEPAQKEAYPYLRIRFLREKQDPLEVQLRALEKPKPALAQYSGKIDPWSGSFIGLEMDFSLDGKLWKKLGRSLRGHAKKP